VAGLVALAHQLLWWRGRRRTAGPFERG
jgi:hypothetical protein